MRPIDADALIKETTEARCVNCDRRKGMKKGKMTFVYEIGETPCRACDVMDMIDALDEAPTVAKDTNVLGKWISVTDQLPENQGTVLIVKELKSGQRQIGLGYCIREYKHHDYATGEDRIEPYWVCGGNNNVIYWQALPDMPEVDEK